MRVPKNGGLCAVTSVDKDSLVFILRLWREPREIEGADPEWRGVIEHLKTGERRYWTGFDDMLDFLSFYAPITDKRSRRWSWTRWFQRKRNARP